jgi:hypothetical protein
MKLLVAVSFMAVIVTTGANGLPPGPARLSLQTKQIATRQLGAFSIAKTYALYNRPAYRQRVGTAVLICAYAVPGWRTCKEYLRLGRGTIIADGLTPASSSFYNLAVVGGTGIYSNTGGTITLQPISHDTQILSGVLEAF